MSYMEFVFLCSSYLYLRFFYSKRNRQMHYQSRSMQVQDAQLPQRDCATRYVSKFVLCFTSYGSQKSFKLQSDLHGHLRAFAMMPFDRPHTISYQCSLATKPLPCTVNVCRSTRLSPELHVQSLQNFGYMLPTAVDRSFSGEGAKSAMYDCLVTVCTVVQDCCKGRSDKYRKWHFWGSCRPETP